VTYLKPNDTLFTVLLDRASSRDPIIGGHMVVVHLFSEKRQRNFVTCGNVDRLP